jgi:esterase/lipase superfamily enzyme
VVVSILPESARRIGDVQWPQTSPGNPATDFVTVRADRRLDASQARKWIGAQGATPKHRALVLVHGFNNRFDDAVFRLAQIVRDTGADMTPMLFTRQPARLRLRSRKHELFARRAGAGA